MMPSLLSLIGAFVAAVTMATACLAGAITQIPRGNDGQTPLPGYLARPPGAGPFPAVVVLHGCNGFNNSTVAWADRLASWGYVALAIDSLTSRGRRTACGSSANEQAADAYQGLKFLASQPFVRSDRIGVLGTSMGGDSVLVSLERGLIEQLFSVKFRSGVALYPPCGDRSGLMTAPTLILIGGRDDWTPAAACREMAAGEPKAYGSPRAPGDRSMIDLVVYPNAYHSFDSAGLRFGPGVRYLGHLLQYDDAATRDAIERVHGFFERTLVGPGR